jgi:hypothetical protein
LNYVCPTEYKTLQDLADFTIENYFPEITSSGPQKYKDFFENICTRTADLMVEWFRVGFVHGVMNTDNMSILGLSIDYGPYSMMDEYDLNFTPIPPIFPEEDMRLENRGRFPNGTFGSLPMHFILSLKMKSSWKIH